MTVKPGTVGGRIEADGNGAEVGVDTEVGNENGVVIGDGVAVSVGGGHWLVIVRVIVIVVVGDMRPDPMIRVVVEETPAMTAIVAAPGSSATSACTIARLSTSNAAASAATVSVAAPTREFSPSNVTRAFCEEQLRFPALSLERTAVSDKVIEKLVAA